ncbi:hypothetical protein [Fibrobacter sp.]|uniref:hypothetical protein n=1 Tax=Fibrobacter sp. TaxID=35828 RepID=UPI0025B81963|nr:hypothetical protein [Fibrobacter sp.]MBR3074115.1 hypothetical protein [Fibrobacter sp.]
MTKRLLLIVVALACMVFANEIPERAEAEGGTDHIYFNGKECGVLNFPLNEFIAKHYAEWPFRPSSARPMYGNPPLYTYYIPKDGGGYLAYWSIRDSSLYLDSVTINSKSHTVPLVRNFYYSKKKDNRIVSVNIPPQEIVLNTSAEKRTVKIQKSEPLFANFVSDTIEFNCGWSHIYKSVVREGKVISLPKELSYGEKPHSKKSDENPIPKPYREFSSPFENYYKILDSLRIAIDVMNSEDKLEQLRVDPRFKWFEKLFNINAVDLDHGHPLYARDDDRSFYVSPKGNTPFKEILLGLKHDENPIESVKLFLRTVMVMQKNPAFEKWLRYKIPLMNYYHVYLEKSDSVFVLWEPIDKDIIWKEVGMKGEYVGTLSFFNWGTHQYEFILSDNGDALVTWAEISKDVLFFDIPIDDNNLLYKSFGKYFVAGMKRCRDSRIDFKITESNKNALFCDYLIIRHDGAIEYGPKSGYL